MKWNINIWKWIIFFYEYEYLWNITKVWILHLDIFVNWKKKTNKEIKKSNHFGGLTTEINYRRVWTTIQSDNDTWIEHNRSNYRNSSSFIIAVGPFTFPGFLQMTLVALFLNATKLAGVLVTLTVAANAFSFNRYRRKNLRPFVSPIDDSSDVLADFTLTGISLLFHSLLLM